MEKKLRSFMIFLVVLLTITTACRKEKAEEEIIKQKTDLVKQKTNLEIRKEVLMSSVWHLSNKCCPDHAFNLEFDQDSVTEINYITSDFMTWYNSKARGAYTLTDDSIKFINVFYLFGFDILPYRLNKDSLIIYPTPESIIMDTYIFISDSINGKP